MYINILLPNPATDPPCVFACIFNCTSEWVYRATSRKTLQTIWRWICFYRRTRAATIACCAPSFATTICSACKESGAFTRHRALPTSQVAYARSLHTFSRHMNTYCSCVYSELDCSVIPIHSCPDGNTVHAAGSAWPSTNALCNTIDQIFLSWANRVTVFDITFY